MADEILYNEPDSPSSFDLLEEEDQELSTPDNFLDEFDQLVSDDNFFEQPYNDQLSALRSIYLGPDKDGTRTWDDEDKVVDLYKEAAGHLREANGKLIQKEDYEEYLPKLPNLDGLDTKTAHALLDDWEEQALKAGPVQLGIGWDEISEVAEQQIKDSVDMTKRVVTAKNYYKPETLEGEKPRGLELGKEDLARFSTALKSGIMSLPVVALMPGEFGEELRREIATASSTSIPFLPGVEVPLVDLPENVSEAAREKEEPLIETPFGKLTESQLISGLGSGVGSVVSGGALARGASALGLTGKARTAATLAPLMGTGAKMSYQEAYTKVFEKTQNAEKAAEAGWLAVPGGLLDGAMDAAIGLGLVPAFFTKLGNKIKTKALAKISSEGWVGKGLQTGFTAAGEGLTEGVQDYLTGKAAATVADDPSLETTSEELQTSVVAGTLTGGIAGAVTSAMTPSTEAMNATERFFRNLKEQSQQQEPIVEGPIPEGEQLVPDTAEPVEETEQPVKEPGTAPETKTPETEPTTPEQPETATEPVSPEPTPKEEKVDESQIQGREITRIPIKSLEYNAPDIGLKQFKKGADERGIVEPLKGFYDPLGAKPVMVFEPDKTAPGRKVIATGRHSTHLAERSADIATALIEDLNKSSPEELAKSDPAFEKLVEEKTLLELSELELQDPKRVKESVIKELTGLDVFNMDLSSPKVLKQVKDALQNRTSISGQTMRESEGFTVEDAEIIDAELNIRDGTGTTQDFAAYFRGRNISKAKARKNELLRTAAGKRAFEIGTKASSRLYNLHRSEQISDEAAAAIANAAPNDAALQQIGVDRYLANEEAGKANIPEALATEIKLEVAKTEGPPAGTQDGLFEDEIFSDSEAMAIGAESLRKETTRLINEPKLKTGSDYITRLAAITGLDVANMDLNNPVDAKLIKDTLKDKERALINRKWFTDPALKAEVGIEAKRLKSITEATRKAQGEQTDLLTAPTTPTAPAAPAPVATEAGTPELAPMSEEAEEPTGPVRGEQGSPIREQGRGNPFGPLQGAQKSTSIFESAIREAQASEIPKTLEHPVYGTTDTIPEGIYEKNPPVQTEKPSSTEKKGKPVNAPQVVDALTNVLRAIGSLTPVREATDRGRTSAGRFEVHPSVIRTKTANDIPTVAHEVWHALEKFIFGKDNPWTKKGTSRLLQKELFNRGKELYGDKKPNGGYMREGFAEFGNDYITGFRDTKKEMPLFHKWFEGEFLKNNPALVEPIREAQRLAREYYGQNPLDRARAGIVEDKNLYQRMRNTLTKPFRDRVSRQQKNWVEFGRPIFELQKIGEKLAQKHEDRKLTHEEKAYDMYDSLRMTHIQRVNYMVKHSMIDAFGNKVGPGLEQIFAKVRENAKQRKIDANDFTVYLWAKRSKALWDDSERGPRNPGLSRQDADSIIKELYSPEWDAAAAEYYAWQDGLRNYVSQMSPYYANIFASILAVDPGFYIPLQREFHKLDSLWDRSQRRDRNRQVGGSPLRRLRGSGRRILNPIDSSIKNAEHLVLAAHQRAVLDSVMKLSRIEDMGHLITKIERRMVPVVNRNLAELLKDMVRVLQKNGVVSPFTDGTGINVEDLFSGDQEISIETLEEFAATLFAPAVKPPKGEVAHMIHRNEKGKLEFYEIDSELLDALAGMDMVWFSRNPFTRWGLQIPNNVFRLGTTGARFGFSFVTNPLRDAPTMVFNYPGSTSVPGLLFSWMKSQPAALFHTFGKTDPYLDLAERWGVTMGHSGAQAQRLFRTRRKLLGGHTVIDVGSNFYDFLMELFQVPEKGTRRAVLKSMMDEMNLKPGDNFTPEDVQRIQQLMLGYKQTTTDFSAAGEYSRVINTMVPYFNAAIQGPRAHLRAVRRNPKRTGAIALAMAGLAAANWFRNKDEDWRKELSDEEKFLFNWIPFENPITNEKQFLKIIRPFELGGITMALTEAILDATYQSKPEIIKAWAESFLSTTLPLSLENWQPVLLREWIDQKMGPGGYDQFWDRPIVPFGETEYGGNIPPEQQFSEYTSETAKFIGNQFGWSPRRIDHAIKGILGGSATDLIAAGETLAGLRAARPDRFKSLTGNEGVDFLLSPFTARLLREEDEMYRSSETVNKFYENVQDVRLFRKRNETEEAKRIMSVFTDAQRSLSALRSLRLEARKKEDRTALNKKAIEIADKANRVWQERNLGIAGNLREERRALERREKASKALKPKPPRSTRPSL